MGFIIYIVCGMDLGILDIFRDSIEFNMRFFLGIWVYFFYKGDIF